MAKHIAICGKQYITGNVPGANTSIISHPDSQLTSFPSEICLLNQLNMYLTSPSILFIHHLDLHNNAITSIPNNIGELLFLKMLNLNHNKLIVLPDSIVNLKNLTHVDFSNNELVSLPERFGKLANPNNTEITILNLSNNQLTILPENFNKLQINILDIGSNKFIEFPKSINVQCIKHLNICNNQIINLPNNLDKLSSFMFNGNKGIILNDSCTKFLSQKICNIIDQLNCGTEFKENLFNNTQCLSGPESKKKSCSYCSHHNDCMWLRCISYGISKLPDNIGDHIKQNLITINLSNNMLTSLPDNIGQCDKITYINLSNNLLTSLPNWVGHCASLTTLNIENNQLKCLPLFYNAGQLTYIYAKNNKLEYLPILDFGNCSVMDFSNNNLTKLPKNRDGLCLISSRSLLLNNNNIIELPTTWTDRVNHIDVSNNRLTCTLNFNSTNMKQIVISNNMLSELNIDQSCIFINASHNNLIKFSANLTNINNLDLSHNNLTEFSSNFSNDINHLNLSHNNLTEFSSDLTNTKLTHLLDLSHNNLTELPPSISSIKTKTINLSNNKLVKLPPNFNNIGPDGERPQIILDLSNNRLSIAQCSFSFRCWGDINTEEQNPPINNNIDLLSQFDDNNLSENDEKTIFIKKYTELLSSMYDESITTSLSDCKKNIQNLMGNAIDECL
jgi:Leucine-rich repeat (LRR) protein